MRVGEDLAEQGGIDLSAFLDRFGGLRGNLLQKVGRDEWGREREEVEGDEEELIERADYVIMLVYGNPFPKQKKEKKGEG